MQRTKGNNVKICKKEDNMQYAIDTHVKEGHLELSNLPFEDGVAVKVVLIPKASLSKMSLKKV